MSLTLVLCMVLSVAISHARIIDLDQSMSSTTTRARRPFVNFLQFNKRRFTSTPTFGRQCQENLKVRTYDGFCNNVLNPKWGSVQTKFLRKGTSIIFNIDKLPNARLVSNVICKETAPRPNRRGMSELVTYFGQFIDHTITETENSKTAWPIEVPAGDPVFADGSTIPFFRTRQEGFGVLASPLNGLSAYIDGASVYGPHEEDARSLRTLKGGMLRLDASGSLPRDSLGFFLAGDMRVNENPLLTTLHTLWAREHNRVAAEVVAAFPTLNDEDVYQLARAVTVAELQAVTFYEFVPAILGRSIRKYPGYTRWRRAGITAEFSTVGFRVGHTLVNSHITAISSGGGKKRRLLRESFFNPKVYLDDGIDALARGMLHTRAAEVDAEVTDEVRDFLVTGDAARTLHLDLASLNVQRGRDHGMPSYNSMRIAYRLRPYFRFSQITPDVAMQRKLQEVYGTVSKIDPWIGGIAEKHKSGSLGELFGAIWEEQFALLRDGDRFYFEKDGLFTAEQIAKIPTLKSLIGDRSAIGNVMKNVIVRNTGVKASEIKKSPFFV